ncbi:MAG: biotin transporter BioY, partial [Erysipelotrichales bacterium]
MKTKEMAKISLFIGLFFICSNIIPPINIIGISFTFQTILILLIPFMLNVKEIIIWYVVLILICAIGIPIMSGFSGGLGVLIGP